jgi:hypothetical protein
VPFKTNQDRRHHIPKQRHRVTNWAAYDIALRQRGSLTVWFTEAAIAAWKAEPRATRGGQPLSQFRAAPVKSSFSVLAHSVITNISVVREVQENAAGRKLHIAD